MNMRQNSKLFSCILGALLLFQLFSLNIISVKASPDTLNPEHDGLVYEQGSGGSGRTYANPVGDHDDEPEFLSNVEIRILMKFNLTGINGNVSSATLKLHIRSSRVNDTNYWSPDTVNPGLGDCLVRHIADYNVSTFPSVTHFNAPSIGNDPGVLIPSDQDAVPGSWVSIDITDAMNDDLSNEESYMAFLIYMELGKDNDDLYDFWEISDMEALNSSLYPYIEFTLSSDTPELNTNELVNLVEDVGLPQITEDRLVDLLESINGLIDFNKAAAKRALRFFIRRIIRINSLDHRYPEMSDSEAEDLINIAQTLISNL
jgi:hypothetical protein